MNKYQSVDFTNVDICGGFWKDRQNTNRKITVYAVWKQFLETGRFAAFEMNWQEGMPNKPHYYWDSDIAKLIEGAAYIIKKHPDSELEKMIEDTIDLIEKNQDLDGYFNIWFTVIEPTERFTKRSFHELYCAGHLIEAAVAYYEATGRKRFLDCMCRYADYIARVFMEEKSASFETPGHEEIELALVRLYHCTQNEKYLQLSQWFLDRRGVSEKDAKADVGNEMRRQSHIPVRKMREAVGHAVRAGYLYSAMADVAYETEDEELLEACKELFENIVQKRMYITGGVGSTFIGEAFTCDYDLPNDTAYSETCAAVALAMFAKRMLKADLNSIYADTIERILYNGFLSATSLDGKKFFYENPLEINVVKHYRLDNSEYNAKERLPITERVEVFRCSCCPPNIVRFVASVGDYIYTYNEQSIYVHQYMDSVSTFTQADREIKVIQKTKYPVEGAVSLKASGVKGKILALRIPGWCTNFMLRCNECEADYWMEKGYAMIRCEENDISLDLELEMKPVWMEAHTDVTDNAGLAALQFGPIVYCMEGVDHQEKLSSLYGDVHLNYTFEQDSAYPLPAIRVNGWHKKYEEKEGLYRTFKSDFEPARLRFVPYYTFANRGECDMQVWVKIRA